MRAKLVLMRTLIAIGGLLLIASPSSAFAHDAVGGDELAAANWMLIGAMITVAMGILAGIWAAKSGQFSNVEESKYRMLDLADDYDAIMAEADEQELALEAAGAAQAQQPIPQGRAAAREIQPGRADTAAHI